MVPALLALINKRNEIGRELRALLLIPGAEKRDFTSEEKEKRDKLNAAFDEARAAVTRYQETEQRAREIDDIITAPDGDASIGLGDVNHRPAEQRDARPAETAEQRDARLVSAFQGWLAMGTESGPSDVQREAMKRSGIRTDAKSIRMSLCPTGELRAIQMQARMAAMGRSEVRAMSAHTAGSGGALVVETFIRQFEQARLAFGGILSVCDQMTTATGERMSWPTGNDTGNTGEQIDENQNVETEADPLIGAIYLDSYDFSSKMVKVSEKLLRDSAFDFSAIIAPMLGERIARILNQRLTTGTGAGQPKGIVTAAALGVTAASSTAFTWKEINDLIYSVPKAYRGPGAGFMFHDSVEQYLQTLNDGEGRPLWLPEANGAPPTRLRAFPFAVSMEMDSAFTTGQKLMLFGQLKSYKYRRVGSLIFKRLDELYAATRQVGFIAFESGDGNLLNAGVNPVRYLQLA